MNLVDVMIVGAGRSGTSSLLRYLDQHPDLRGQQTPELTWFSDPADLDPETVAERAWGPSLSPGELRLGKAAGLMYEPDGLARLETSSPGVQLAVILREPVQRTYSGYWFARARGLEPLESFEAAVWADPARFDGSPTGRTLAYLDWSQYAHHLTALFEQFGRERVHTLFFEEFVADPRAAVSSLLAACGLDAADLPAEARQENAAIRARHNGVARMRKRRGGLRQLVPASVRRSARSVYQRVNEAPAEIPPMDERVRADLRAWFEEPNQRLEELLGRPVPASWSTKSRGER